MQNLNKIELERSDLDTTKYPRGMHLVRHTASKTQVRLYACMDRGMDKWRDGYLRVYESTAYGLVFLAKGLREVLCARDTGLPQSPQKHKDARWGS